MAKVVRAFAVPAEVTISSTSSTSCRSSSGKDEGRRDHRGVLRGI